MKVTCQAGPLPDQCPSPQCFSLSGVPAGLVHSLFTGVFREARRRRGAPLGFPTGDA